MRLGLFLKVKERRIALLTLAATLFVVWHSSPVDAQMYPRALDANSNAGPNEAIVIVANAGPDTINYLQFVHSWIPAINVSDIVLRPNSVVAIAIPVGTRNLSLQNYTTTARGGGYFASGMSFGYVPVRTPEMNINTPGLYFVATVFPGRQGQNYSTRPGPGTLAKFKATYPRLTGLKPINF